MGLSRFLPIFFTILAVSMGQISFKYGVARAMKANAIEKMSAANIFTLLIDPFVLLGLGLAGLGAISWVVALAKFPLNTAYPMIAVTFAIVMLLSVAVLGEPLTAGKIFGSVLIISGVVVVALGA